MIRLLMTSFAVRDLQPPAQATAPIPGSDAATAQPPATPEALDSRVRTDVFRIVADRFAILDQAARRFRGGAPLVVAGRADKTGSGQPEP